MGNDAVEERLEDQPINQGRRRFLTATTAVVGAVGVGFVAVPFIKSWNPSAKAKLAGAPVKQDISALQDGMRIVLEWRGQPIWIVKRTKQMLDILPTLDSRLRDPKSTNADQQPAYVLKGDYHYRSIKPEISVLVGICTHLGCSPEMVAEIKPEPFDPDWKGGYFCPCHKSRYDMAGRVYDGVPAPFNLAVPPHNYESDTMIVIGLDPGSSTSTGAA
ncbi:ubiquinol-cytochrome c reductase iron-sulfur subunit [Cognatiluteimonas profundi]|jgi:ubiquinol-cytochrome c reductase iron-sulfur subunit|uniref:ubiquinol-cytochrome c reductase iron-sulfur subunit n=1 Tax=Cognatiluteimonas profundi TaxID=2594501 RepID=UPI00131E6C0C|nr:ubiquinol-cytochrome c reductase iron-sulfur subunit [Lysobacter profundi]